MNPQVWWFVARASGIVAWLSLTASVLWGIVLSTKVFAGRRRPAWLLAMHRWLAGMTLSFLFIHVAAILLDGYVSFGLADVTVPFVSSWKPIGVALGIIAMWLLVAVEVTSLAMRHLPRRAWRAIHLFSYVAFFGTSLHAAMVGTDAFSLLYRVPAVLSVALVSWAVITRILERSSGGTPSRAASAGIVSQEQGREIEEVLV